MTTQVFSGVDIVRIDRIQAAASRWGYRFLQQIYTPAELAYCNGRAERLAGRWAAKEAGSKVLRTGIRALRWQDIEILADERGRPHLSLHAAASEAAANLALTRFDISLAYSDGQALAIIFAWGSAE